MRLMQFAVAATFAACRLHILCLLFLQHLPSYQHSTLRRLVPASRNLPAYISTVAISVGGDAVLSEQHKHTHQEHAVNVSKVF